MFSEKDVLVLKLVLERRLLDALAYARLREGLQPGARLAQVLRKAGVPGRDVGLVMEAATPIGSDTQAAIPARCDVENVLTGQALLKAGLVTAADLTSAQGVIDRAATQEGLFFDVAEILVEEGRLDLLQGAALRRGATGLVTTCPRCFRHYLLRKRKQSRCAAPCNSPLAAGEGVSAIDAWRAGERSGTSGHFRSPKASDSDSQPLELKEPEAEADSKVAPSDLGLLPSGDDLQVAHIEASLVIADEDLASSAQEVSAGFGPYEIAGEINRGGNGVVYRARRPGESQVLALKVLIAGPKATAQQVARFEREGKVGKRLDHRGIARVFDMGKHAGYRYIAMEYVAGETLEELIEGGRALEPRRAAELVVDVADAVDYLHGQGVIHRDLKPENVIVSETGPKLIDFGLAKTSDTSGDKLTQDASALGTPSFMSPEQVRGESDRVTAAADVYALGAILYTLSTGALPFVGANFMDLFRQIVQEEVVPPEHKNPQVPAPLSAIVRHAMAKRAEQRYPTAADFRDDLQRFLAGEPVEANPPPVAGAGKRRASANRQQTILVGLCVAAAVLLVLALLLLAST